MSQNLAFRFTNDMVQRIARQDTVPRVAKEWIVDLCKVLVELNYTGDVVIGTIEPVDTPDEVTHEGSSEVSAG